MTKKELGSVFTEGFTDYMAYRIAHSAGVHTREHFARALTRFYLEYLDVASSALSEADAEFLRYRQGMMAAWVLDVELQRISKGKYGFRELIWLLVKQHANTDGLTKQELIAALTTIGGERFAALYEQLTGTDASVDFSLFMKSTGIQIKPVQNPGQALKEFLKGGDSVISFAPANQSEKGFLNHFLSR